MPIGTCFVALCLMLALLPAAAQHAASTTSPRLIISEKAIADATAGAPRARLQQRDSVKNGAIIGAIVGAAAVRLRADR